MLLSEEHLVEHSLAAAQDYISKVLMRPVRIGELAPINHVPAFLKDHYHLVYSTIGSQECLFMVAKNTANSDTPANIARHYTHLAHAFNDQVVIYITSHITSHDRQRLIAQGVPFIIPQRQLFIPELAIDLREYFSVNTTPDSSVLSPAAQVVLLGILLDKQAKGITASELASRYEYSKMSMGRAIKELEHYGLGFTEKRGRQRPFFVELPASELWVRARRHLQTPVQDQRIMAEVFDASALPFAGESALSQLTNLTEPWRETRAVGSGKVRSLVIPKPAKDSDYRIRDSRPEIEVWHYDPQLLSKNNVVDPLSLYLSLPDTGDERFQAAKEDLLAVAGITQ